MSLALATKNAADGGLMTNEDINDYINTNRSVK
jgi:hypothetical protein